LISIGIVVKVSGGRDIRKFDVILSLGILLPPADEDEDAEEEHDETTTNYGRAHDARVSSVALYVAIIIVAEFFWVLRIRSYAGTNVTPKRTRSPGRAYRVAITLHSANIVWHIAPLSTASELFNFAFLDHRSIGIAGTQVYEDG
jgi:hypothetical protein